VFDEAHQLEDVATDFFGLRVSTSKVDALVRDAQRALGLAGRAGDPRARRVLEQIEEMSRAFFATLTARALSSPPRSSRNANIDAEPESLRTSPRPWEVGSRRMLVRDSWTDAVSAAHGKLDAALEALSTWAEEHAAEADGLIAAARRAARLRVELAEIGEGSRAREGGPAIDPDAFPIDEPPRPHPTVAWLEVRDRSVSVGASRVDLARELSELVWSRVPTVICTSATLATADREGQPTFTFVKERLGAPVDAIDLVVPSPFDFATRAGLYVPRDLPDPSDPGFDAAAAMRVADLLEISGGGAFVLCTSTRAMTRLYEALSALGRWDVMVQGDGARHALLERFRAHGHAVLVATMSFWEGVDVPGHALRLVVIDRVPFAVPTDPVVMARSESIERAGGNAFAEYTLPAAAILLKQGFGRLLRSSRDAGVVALLDRRTLTKRYGRALLAALPPAKRLHALSDVRAFWEQVGSMDASTAG
jgi:ATP-dependent DNA helicase DinG